MRNYGTTDTYQQTTRRQRGGRQRTAGVAAVPVGGGRAWPDNESTRRAKLAARTTRGRAAAHEHTKQPGTTSNATGGPLPTSTPSSPAPRATPRAGRRPRAHQAARHHNQILHRPEHQRRNTPPRHSKAAQPRRGRAAQPVSEDHRRITTISGLPRPLSWRTFEIPSFEAMSLAVPSIRGSS